jgi:hypothetical protein
LKKSPSTGNSSDIQFDESLLRSVNETATLLFHDCGLDKSQVHTSIDELLSLPREIQEKIWIMHYPDHLEEYMKTNDMGRLNIVEQHKRYVLKK